MVGEVLQVHGEKNVMEFKGASGGCYEMVRRSPGVLYEWATPTCSFN